MFVVDAISGQRYETEKQKFYNYFWRTIKESINNSNLITFKICIRDFYKIADNQIDINEIFDLLDSNDPKGLDITTRYEFEMIIASNFSFTSLVSVVNRFDYRKVCQLMIIEAFCENGSPKDIAKALDNLEEKEFAEVLSELSQIYDVVKFEQVLKHTIQLYFERVGTKDRTPETVENIREKAILDAMMKLPTFYLRKRFFGVIETAPDPRYRIAKQIVENTFAQGSQAYNQVSSPFVNRCLAYARIVSLEDYNIPRKLHTLARTITVNSPVTIASVSKALGRSSSK